MSYQVALGDPSWSFSVPEFEKKAAEFLKSQAITSEAAKNSFIAAATSVQLDNMTRALFQCVLWGPPQA